MILHATISFIMIIPLMFFFERIRTRKSALLLGSLLAVFLLKGLVFAAILPIFQGPDEQLHYAAVQKHAYPRIQKISKLPKDNDMYVLRIPEETATTAKKTQLYELRFDPAKTQHFSDTSEGIFEAEIRDNAWSRTLPKNLPSDIPPTKLLYYKIGAVIERTLSNQDIFTRFFSLRILSVLFGTIIIFLSYFIVKKIGFSEKYSLILAAIIAFQPMFSTTAAIVNPDILLVLAFTLYTYAAVSLLKEGLRPLPTLILFASIALGIISKGPGIVLAITTCFLFVFLGYRSFAIPLKSYIAYVAAASILLGLLIFSIVPTSYFMGIVGASAPSKFPSFSTSLARYAEETINPERTFITVASYWGHFGWLDARLPKNMVNVILILELSLFFLVIPFTLLRKKYPEYLPEKRFVVFLLGMIVALQLAIRFYDWRVFDYSGTIGIGTPGRYFLPNIAAHMILFVIGAKLLFFHKKRSFEILLKTMLILMVTLNLYSIFHVIIPRYYL